MYGDGIGSLNIYLETNSSKNLVWSLSGNKESKWQQGIAPFKSDDIHHILIEGVRGDNDRGDIALVIYNISKFRQYILVF